MKAMFCVLVFVSALFLPTSTARCQGFCAAGPCRSSGTCFSGCVCFIPAGKVMGTCAEIR